MDKLEQLIKTLAEFKEELNKNVNMSYSGQTNVTKADMNKKPDIVKPDTGYGKITIKDTNPMPDPKKPGAYGKVIIKKEEVEKEDKMMGKGCGMGSMKMAKNGQWSLNKSDLNKAKGEVQKLYRVGPEKKHMTMVKPWHEVDHDNTGMGHRHLMEVHSPGKPDHGTQLSVHHKQVEGFNQSHPPVEPKKLK